MAFPVVQTADTKSGTVTSNSTSWTATYPTNIAQGDLILAFAGTDGGSNPSWGGSGWRSMSNSQSSYVTLDVAAKIANGTESGNLTITLAASEQGSWRIFRITGWSGLLYDPMSTARIDFPSSTPTPATLNASWTDDTLWVAACAVDTSRTVTAFPSNYTNTSSDVSGGANGATLAICFRELRAASETPGTFTISNSDNWITETIAIRPKTPNPWDTIV